MRSAPVLAVLIALAPGRVRAQGRAQSTRGVAPSAIQRELIALLISGARRPALRGDEQWLDNHSALLGRLGRIHTRSAIRALVELTAYDLGTSGGDVKLLQSAVERGEDCAIE